MKVMCPLCNFTTEFSWSIYPVLDKKGNKYPESLTGLLFFYNCPKCDAPLNVEVTLVPNKKNFKLKIHKRKTDYIG